MHFLSAACEGRVFLPLPKGVISMAFESEKELCPCSGALLHWNGVEPLNLVRHLRVVVSRKDR